jgi:hypothetical protein
MYKYQNQEFTTLSDLARVAGVSSGALRRRVKRGQCAESAVKALLANGWVALASDHKSGHSVKVAGRVYDSVTQARDGTGLSANVIVTKRRFLAGVWLFKGKEYGHITDLVEATDVPRVELVRMMGRGVTPDNAHNQYHHGGGTNRMDLGTPGEVMRDCMANLAPSRWADLLRMPL